MNAQGRIPQLASDLLSLPCAACALDRVGPESTGQLDGVINGTNGMLASYLYMCLLAAFTAAALAQQISSTDCRDNEQQ